MQPEHSSATNHHETDHAPFTPPADLDPAQYRRDLHLRPTVSRVVQGGGGAGPRHIGHVARDSQCNMSEYQVSTRFYIRTSKSGLEAQLFLISTLIVILLSSSHFFC